MSTPSVPRKTALRPGPSTAPERIADAFDLDTFLPYRLAVAADAVSSGLATVYASRFGLTIPEWRLIANLGRDGVMTASEAAARATLDKVQVTRASQRLIARKLVARRVDRADRRRVSLTLTAAGASVRAEIADLARAWERQLLAGLAPQDRTALNRALASLTARAATLAAAV